MFRCVDCGCPVDDDRIAAIKNLQTNEVDFESLTCDACEVLIDPESAEFIEYNSPDYDENDYDFDSYDV